MGDQPRAIRLATIQAAPVFLDCEATLAKAVGLIAEAASDGAELILLPESFVPGNPVWLWSSDDGGDAWQSTLRHLAYEGRVFAAASCQVLSHATLRDEPVLAGFPPGDTWIMRGGSAIVAPGGDCDYLAGPLFDQEGILGADLDLAAVARAKHSFDVAGHYARPDVFELHVSRTARRPVIVEDRLG